MASEVSSDMKLLFQILTRLPAKSICRFKCVSKQWHLFPTTPMFKTMHFRHINPNKLLLLSTTTPRTYRTIDCEAPEDGLTAIRSLPLDATNMSIETLLHGLVCVGLKKCRYDFEYSDLVLWNPLTDEYKILSKGNSHKEYYNVSGRAFGLYYSSSDDNYKLLRVTHERDIYIYSLKSDSWRKVEATMDFRTIPYCISESWKPCSYPMNDKLYFLKDVEGESQSSRSYSIIKFDTKSEKFTKIATPSFKKIRIACLSFVILKGRIHLCVTYDDSKGHSMEPCLMFDLWRMNRDGDEEWMKVESFCQKLCIQVSQPLHLMRNGNWL